MAVAKSGPGPMPQGGRPLRGLATLLIGATALAACTPLLGAAWLQPPATREQAGRRSCGGLRGALAGRCGPRPPAPAGSEASLRAAVSWFPQPGPIGPWGAGGLAALALGVLGLQRLKVWLETPSRPYSANNASNSVRAEYDQWTREGVLEHYWGEHIHMGSYTPLEKQKGYSKGDPFVVAFARATVGHLIGKYKDFIDAKLDFSKEMLAWSGATKPKRILDVGCGIGGTSRFLARTFPEAQVIGITLSPEQVQRATALAKEAGLSNAKFQVTNALNMDFEDGTFDLVWGCESGEHMPDKKKYIEEMSRVLAPGGNLVVATWCERDPVPPFTSEERTALKFVYEEWSHPYFISISSYGKTMEGTGVLQSVQTEDWTERTLPSWRHSIWVGVWSPWYWLKVAAKRPKAFLGFLRDAYTLERYHRAMRRGLLTYGMMKAIKKSV